MTSPVVTYQGVTCLYLTCHPNFVFSYFHFKYFSTSLFLIFFLPTVSSFIALSLFFAICFSSVFLSLLFFISNFLFPFLSLIHFISLSSHHYFLPFLSLPLFPFHPSLPSPFPSSFLPSILPFLHFSRF